jgi:hypothetical protein
MRRNLVIVRAGEGSLHESWLGGGTRSFDLVVSYWGDDPFRFRTGDVIRIDHKGGKFDGLHALLTGRQDLFDRYDYIWIADDDIVASRETIDRLFATMRRYDLLIAQPALSADSYLYFPLTLEFPSFELRYTNVVEAMVPCFNAAYLRQVAPLFGGLRYGWGLDYIWTRLMPEPAGRAAVIDSCVVRHTRQFGSGALYRNAEKPLRQFWDLFERFGLKALPAFGAYAGITVAGERVAMDSALAERGAREAWSRLSPLILGQWSRRQFLKEFVAQHRADVDLTPVRETQSS